MLTYSFDDRGMDFLYEHLYKEIKNDILIGNLKAHEKLPSKRALAAHLNVSVVTVENSYSQLLAEGYIYSKPKSGFYVCDVKAEDADVVGVHHRLPHEFRPCRKWEVLTEGGIVYKVGKEPVLARGFCVFPDHMRMLCHMVFRSYSAQVCNVRFI